MIKFSICFFGMNRSLSYTINSIKNNIFSAIPCEWKTTTCGALMNCAHSFSNLRSEEFGATVERNFEKLISPDSYEVIDQTEFDLNYRNSLLALDLKDIYSDNYASLMNIIRELYSIQRAWSWAKKNKPDVILFLRPDLNYLDKFDFQSSLNLCGDASRPIVMTPIWQKWGGVNDRFALTNFRGAEVYGNRFNFFWKYVLLLKNYPQAESLLFTTLFLNGVDFECYLPQRAARVRSGGNQRAEDYNECGSNDSLKAYLSSIL